MSKREWRALRRARDVACWYSQLAQINCIAAWFGRKSSWASQGGPRLEAPRGYSGRRPPIHRPLPGRGFRTVFLLWARRVGGSLRESGGNMKG